MAHLENVTITPNPVLAKEQCIVSVAISTWDYLNKNYTWSELAAKKWSEVNSQWQEEGGNG